MFQDGPVHVVQVGQGAGPGPLMTAHWAKACPPNKPKRPAKNMPETQTITHRSQNVAKKTSRF
jgi:hypothetical protein